MILVRSYPLLLKMKNPYMRIHLKVIGKTLVHRSLWNPYGPLDEDTPFNLNDPDWRIFYT